MFRLKIYKQLFYNKKKIYTAIKRNILFKKTGIYNMISLQLDMELFIGVYRLYWNTVVLIVLYSLQCAKI